MSSIDSELAPNGLVWWSGANRRTMLPSDATPAERVKASSWTQEELDVICDPNRPTDRVLAAQLRRTMKAIRCARNRAKAMDRERRIRQGITEYERLKAKSAAVEQNARRRK